MKQRDKNIKAEVLIKEIQLVRDRLRKNRFLFDNTSEPDLIESIIFEEKALLARYDYLIREAKEKGVKAPTLIT